MSYLFRGIFVNEEKGFLRDQSKTFGGGINKWPRTVERSGLNTLIMDLFNGDFKVILLLSY